MSAAALEASAAAWQRLEATWAATQVHWHDAATDRFERQYWEPLAQDVETLHRALEELTEAIAEARLVLRLR